VGWKLEKERHSPCPINKMKTIKSLLSSAKGSQSIMRFAFMNIIIMDYIILLTWIAFCIKAGKIVDIGERIADFAGFINAAGFLGKAGQSYVERRYDPADDALRNREVD